MRFALIMCLFAPVAHADKAQDALKLLDEGIKLFNDGELNEARDDFARVRDMMPDKANPYRWLGLVDARMGRCGDAIKELEIFLQKVPPNDQRVAEAVTLRDRCREDLQPRVGALVIETTPPGAEVRLDDSTAPSSGVTPFRSEAVPAGNHVVFIRRAGFEPVTRGVQVTPKETARVALNLTPLPGAKPVIVEKEETDQVTYRPVKKRPYWVAGLVVGVVVAAGVAVGLGVGLTYKPIEDFGTIKVP